MTPEVAGSSPVNHPTRKTQGALPITRFRNFIGERSIERPLVARVFLLLLAVALPLGGAASMLISQQNAKVELTQREWSGLGFTRRTVDVVRALRALRDRMELDNNIGILERRDVENALDALYDYNDHEGSSLELTKRLRRLAEDWAEVPESSKGGAQVEAALKEALKVFEILDDRSELSADADAETADLIDAYGTQLPALTDRTDTAKLFFVGKAANRGADNRIDSAMFLGMARRAYGAAERDVIAAAKVDPSAASLEDSVRQAGKALNNFMILEERPTAATRRWTPSTKRKKILRRACAPGSKRARNANAATSHCCRSKRSSRSS